MLFRSGEILLLCREKIFRPLVMVNLLVVVDNTASTKKIWTESWGRSCGVLERVKTLVLVELNILLIISGQLNQPLE